MGVDALLALIPSLPFVLVAAVGIVLAAVRARRHPQVSALVIVGLVLSVLPALASVPLQLAILSGGRERDSEIALLGVVGGASALLSVVGLALLVAAALGWRSAPAAPLPAADRDAAWRVPDAR